MKVMIWALICRAIVILAILGFVLAIVKITNNTKFLWLLFLVLSAELIPTYEIKSEKRDEDGQQSE